jgi:site-specific recombinase XerD
MSENFAVTAERFVEHRRALGRKYISEEHELRLLVRFAEAQGIDELDQLTAVSLEMFLASRPRRRPRSFNHLLGVIRCFLDWAVIQELLTVSPLEVRRRRVTASRIPFIFDVVQARRLLVTAASLPDNSRARQRGPTYRVIFALCYGLGLRAGEACGLRLGDVDTGRNLLVVRGGKFGKSRFVPYGPRIAELIGAPGRAAADRFSGVRCQCTVVHLRRPPLHASWDRQSSLPCVGPGPRIDYSGRSLAATAARSAPFVRGWLFVALVPRRL